MKDDETEEVLDMRIIWSNIVLYALTVVALVFYASVANDGEWGGISLVASIAVWLMIFITYSVGYRRGKAGKSDGYFLERVDTKR